jgi:hypothetical protein
MNKWIFVEAQEYWQQKVWNTIKSRPEYSYEISPVDKEKLNVTVSIVIFDIADLVSKCTLQNYAQLLHTGL